MSLSDRADLFGDPSLTLAPEAAWSFHEEHGDWPIWEEAIDALADLAQVPTIAAEARIVEAIRTGDLEPRIRGGTALLLGVEVPSAVADRIARRYTDVVLPRRDREEQP